MIIDGKDFAPVEVKENMQKFIPPVHHKHLVHNQLGEYVAFYKNGVPISAVTSDGQWYGPVE